MAAPDVSENTEYANLARFWHVSEDLLPARYPIVLAQIEAELAEILGRKVDLRTPADLSPFFRDQVLAIARVQYLTAEF